MSDREYFRSFCECSQPRPEGKLKAGATVQVEKQMPPPHHTTNARDDGRTLKHKIPHPLFLTSRTFHYHRNTALNSLTMDEANTVDTIVYAYL